MKRSTLNNLNGMWSQDMKTRFISQTKHSMVSDKHYVPGIAKSMAIYSKLDL